MLNELAKELFGRMKAQEPEPSWSDEEIEVVPELSAGDEQDVGWVSVYFVWDSTDAVAIVARMQDEGIPALARPEALTADVSADADAAGQVEVLVPEAMADHAMQVLWELGLLADQDESDDYYAQ